ncbi:hypothetical protein KC332_g2709 [Hortaea werneckii]|nr:hypothetical protein KC358_g1896 [Hortaea werneckii]KAI6852232.1 hypothetical protein KC350_g1072 [Hortaea werneckii]KAI6934337.1 hypothetical protein KC341_g7673 [Hortaea werneckii]KAI6948907.1 hypothetical protein KC348_g1686 [Hortaea werneckii]KAI6969087.1 hypothetical protein KC321_g8094 [Hortaea werneckii]
MCCCSKKAGKKAYKVYQQRQMAEQARLAAYGPTLQPEQYNHRYSSDSLSTKANTEVTEEGGMEPPAYSDVVGEHAAISDEPDVPKSQRQTKVASKGGDEDRPSAFWPGTPLSAASSGQSGSSSTSSEYAPSEGRYKSKWQLKFAEKRAKYEAKQQQRQAEFERKLEERAAKYQQKLEKRAMKGF